MYDGVNFAKRNQGSSGGFCRDSPRQFMIKIKAQLSLSVAKFRSNHVDKDRASFFPRLLFMMIFLCGATLFLFKQAKHKLVGVAENHFWQYAFDTLEIFLPRGKAICKKHFCLQYNCNTGQADWVAYRLSKYQLVSRRAASNRNFTTDTSLGSQAISGLEYNGSGFSKGQLVPSADMAFSDTAITESFLLSNVAPQNAGFNEGIWRELEFQIRQWAWQRGNLLIQTGPVFDKTQLRYLSSKKSVAIPIAFFKIICDPFTAQMDCVSFLIPNQHSDVELGHYVVSIDSVEEVTGIDFFAQYFDDAMEAKVESALSIGHWPLDSALYYQRVKKWNCNSSR